MKNWKKISRLVTSTGMLAGLLLGAAACTQAQAPRFTEPMFSTPLRATANFSELAQDSSPFVVWNTSADNSPVVDTASATDSGLPDDPSFAQIGQQKPDPRIPAVPGAAGRVANHPNRPDIGQYTKYIPAGYVTRPQTVHQKVLTGAEDLYSFGNVAGWFLSAGWSQVVNNSPNYGTDRGAFGQRLGAAAIRSTSQGVFTDIVLSPILHQDLRYYVKGPRYSVLQRSLYAASRVIVARRDSGSTTINTAMLGGYLGAQALTQAYYPHINRGWNDFTTGYASSLGGEMLANIFSEFQPDILIILHMKHKTYEPFKDNDPSNNGGASMQGVTR